ncbi:MAG: YggS family pyridoxal phosphate-dependent enzyme [Myxococcales bacterium]|nr:YggS family pyridoxal phosphate-dependent enzyme [Myxococcales bacterium]
METNSFNTNRALGERVEDVRLRIHQHCDRVGRSPQSVTLVGVTKTFSAEVCREVHRLGVLDLGENYVSEYLEKSAALSDLIPQIRWHFIGHLQTNKAARILRNVHLIHTVDRPSLVDTLAQKADLLGISVPILMQVNIAGDSSKFGCTPDQAPALVQHIRRYPALHIQGIMTIGPITDTAEGSRPVFRALRTLRDQLADTFGETPTCRWTHLSMGMSHDFGVAIEEGATIVRVGTALFGHR